MNRSGLSGGHSGTSEQVVYKAKDIFEENDNEMIRNGSFFLFSAYGRV